MSSLAGFQGSPRLATYAASKAFNTVLGESLWGELATAWRRRPRVVRRRDPHAGLPKTAKRDAPGTLDAADVAERTLAALGKGPIVVPGAINKLARFFLGRLLSRRAAVGVMARNTTDLE